MRAVLRDVVGWEHVEETTGWLIFKLPPSELGVHPSDGATRHELSLMCDDIAATVSELRAKGIERSVLVTDAVMPAMCAPGSYDLGDVQVELKIDPAIIGGLIVKVGSRMVDSSLRTKLNTLKHAMKEVS